MLKDLRSKHIVLKGKLSQIFYYGIETSPVVDLEKAYKLP
jgi:hypothetical protein